MQQQYLTQFSHQGSRHLITEQSQHMNQSVGSSNFGRKKASIRNLSLLDEIKSTRTGHHHFFQKTEEHETDVSRQIKVLSEVEKIWIIFDIDNSGTLEFNEIIDYLQQMAFPQLDLSLSDIKHIFEKIDKDDSGAVDKDEMTVFLTKLMELQRNLEFIKGKKYIRGLTNFSFKLAH